mmetsp:Transcript_12292/g.26580  ORF Transcript_12292/g.26580 Transcript_12292/m.26580 type:complete len:215 (+) Transcript_12292:898-1542(+)
MVTEVVCLELREEVPKEIVVRADLVVRQLMQQRVDERGVLDEARQVLRAQSHVDALPCVRVVAEQPRVAALHLLGEPVVERVHLGERAHDPPTRAHDRDDRGVARQLEQQLARLERVRRLAARTVAKRLPCACFEAAESVLSVLSRRPVIRSVVPRRGFLAPPPLRRRVFISKAPYGRVGPSGSERRQSRRSTRKHHHLGARAYPLLLKNCLSV